MDYSWHRTCDVPLSNYFSGKESLDDFDFCACHNNFRLFGAERSRTGKRIRASFWPRAAFQSHLF